MTELRKALERPVAGLVFDENRKNAVREKAFTAKRGGSALRRGAAAALVCTALCVTAVAAGPSLWQYIQARQGPFAGLAQTVEGAVCTSGGIEIQVLSALADDVRGEVYFTVRDVEGDRLDSQLTLRCGADSDLAGRLVEYDSESRTALFAAGMSYYRPQTEGAVGLGTTGGAVPDTLHLAVERLTTRQGELDAGLVIDLGCAAPVLARTTLRADPACLLVPRGHPLWEKERVPLSALRGQRVLLPSLRQDLFSPLWDACAREGFAPNAEIGPSFYQAYYLVQEQLCTCLTRYEPGARRELDRVRDVLLEDLPPLCVSMVQRRDHNSAYLDLLRGYLMEVIGGAASLPPRRGRPAKPFYNFPVLSSAAPKAAPQHPAPGTQLPFAGGNNFRELGGYEADEGKHVKWGQIYRGIPTGLLTGAADRKLLDSLGLRLILDLRSESEAAEQPDYVPDGARLVRICGLCHPDGSEISFSPGDIEKLLKGKKDEEHNLADAMYQQMLFRNKAYKELFRALEAGETPILFHCSGGKDRTGVAAMLILLALGASDETICQDFVRTNVCRRPELEKIWAAHAEEIEAHPEQKQFYQGIAGVHPESAPFVLDTIRKEYGTTDAYLEAEYGLTPARLMRLRRMYLE